MSNVNMYLMTVHYTHRLLRIIFVFLIQILLLIILLLVYNTNDMIERCNFKLLHNNKILITI